jgi:hypothetical protein
MFFKVAHGVDAGAFVGEQDVTNSQNKRFGHGLLHEVCPNMPIPVFWPAAASCLVSLRGSSPDSQGS